MPNCPECENDLDVEIEELEEGDVVVCDECGSEYEVVGVEPLELSRVDEGYDEDEDELPGEEEEEERSVSALGLLRSQFSVPLPPEPCHRHRVGALLPRGPRI